MPDAPTDHVARQQLIRERRQTLARVAQAETLAGRLRAPRQLAIARSFRPLPRRTRLA